jgi:mannose-1-phosphate guanylyltransferase
MRRRALVFGALLPQDQAMRYAVILAGGSGHRLWPASRKASPKQFLPLGADAGESLLAATRRRLDDLCPAERILVVTARDQAEMVRVALPELPAHNILAEPAARNTAAALGLAAVHLLHRDPDAILGALPADHHIADRARFAAVARQAFDLAAARDVIVTIGIVPTRPEPGFGYLALGGALDVDAASDVDTSSDAGAAAQGARWVERFVEKPSVEIARVYFESGQYLWNAGMFFVSARRLLRDIERLLPATFAGLDAIAHALRDGGEHAAAARAEEVYPGLPGVSIDHGVMEHTEGVVTLPGDFGWNDVGSWAALADYRAADENGNIVQGTAVLHDSRGNIVVGDSDHVVTLIGVEGLVVVQSGNGILVVPRERAQDVREAVAALQRRALDHHL